MWVHGGEERLLRAGDYEMVSNFPELVMTRGKSRLRSFLE